VPCTHATVFSSRTQIAAHAKTVQSFTTSETGRLELTVDWSFAPTVVSAILSQAPCTLDKLEASECNVQFTLFSPPKPLHESTTLLRAGTYDLILANPNAVPQSFSAQVVLTSVGCPEG
jgi:hypothetical protein